MATLNGTSGNDVLTGTSGKDSLYGLGGEDTLRGGGGDDYLRGGADADHLYGEADNDWLIGGAGGDTLDGGSGADRVSYWGSDAGVEVTLDETGGASGSSVSGGHATGDTLIGIENLQGTEYRDVLTGNSKNNDLGGMGGDDVLNGGGGNDSLAGGAGADELDGGQDVDTAKYGHSDAGVTVDLATGRGLRGHAAGDTLRNIENLQGSSHDDILTGDRFSNSLHGYGGRDTLSGGRGNDHIDGGPGADTLDGGPGTDTLSYAGSDAGVDVRLDWGTASGGHAAGDRIRGFENVVGSKHVDDLRGDEASNELWGGEGGDVLRGGGGDDELIGGGGGDRLIGDAGADTLRGGPGADLFAFVLRTDSTSDARDVIKDFSSSDRDRIDLIDLLRESGGTFAGTAPFAGVAGEARYTQQTVSGTAYTDVFVDVNGNGAADLVVRLEGTHELTASDFLFSDFT